MILSIINHTNISSHLFIYFFFCSSLVRRCVYGLTRVQKHTVMISKIDKDHEVIRNYEPFDLWVHIFFYMVITEMREERRFCKQNVHS